MDDRGSRDGLGRKLWALQQGLLHAEVQGPAAEWPWFTDADIVHAPDVLRRLIAKAKGESNGLALASLMVRLSCEGRVARLLIPPFIFFFQKLCPFAWVNDPQHRLAAAAGGCLLVRCEALRRAGGLVAIRSHLIDDCALAAAVKQQGPIWLGLALTSYSLRQYPRLGERVGNGRAHRLLGVGLLATLACTLRHRHAPCLSGPFEQHGGLGLVLAGVAEIIEHQAIEPVELGDQRGQR